MNLERNVQIEILAYYLWEVEGRPDGRHDEHWAEAERRMNMDGEPPVAPDIFGDADLSDASDIGDIGDQSKLSLAVLVEKIGESSETSKSARRAKVRNSTRS